jgi:hypothetical protein
MAGSTGTAPAATEEKVTTEPAVFKYAVAGASGGSVNWKESLVLVIEQKVLLVKEEEEEKKKKEEEAEEFIPWIMIYESDKKDPWEKKKLADKSGFEAVLAIHGKFDAEGKFEVTKMIPLNQDKAWCEVEVKIKGKDGSDVALKDKDGKDLEKLVVKLPRVDLTEDSWVLDLAFRSSEEYERFQDRLLVKADVKSLLADGSKYVDDRFKPDGTDKNPDFMQTSYSRQAYDYFYIHCMCSPGDPIADWFKYEKMKALLAGIPAIGAHFIIDREGKIHHAVRCSGNCAHAGGIYIGGSKGNSYSLAVELAGLIDDLGVPMLLSRALGKLAKSPPAVSTGNLSAASKQSIKDALAFLFHGSSRKASYTRRTNKMVDAMGAKFEDADFESLTSLWVPDDRGKWDGFLGYYGVTDDAANRAIQRIYCHAMTSGAAGDSFPLKVSNNARVKFEDDKCTCTHATGVDLDTEGEGITLYRMKKDEELPAEKKKDGTILAKVKKADIDSYNDGLLDDANKKEKDRGSQKESVKKLLDLADDAFEKMVGYTDAQYASLADLTQALFRIYNFKGVFTHHYAARHSSGTSRKRDPGGYFDWDEFLGNARLAEMQKVERFKWKASDAARKPKGNAERTHSGLWGTL